MAGLLSSIIGFNNNAQQPTKANVGLLDIKSSELKNDSQNKLLSYSPKPGLVFIGQEHGQKINLPTEVQKLANQTGAFYEGAGGDKLPNIKYKGSWDNLASKSVKGYPPEYLYTIFTNTDVNNQKDALVSNDTIYDSLLKNQKQIGYFKDRRFGNKELDTFLKSVSPEFLADSKKIATEKNVNDFLSRGEKLMWESGNTPARQMADKANEFRQRWLLSQPKGVFFVGSDHLQKLKELGSSETIK